MGDLADEDSEGTTKMILMRQMKEKKHVNILNLLIPMITIVVALIATGWIVTGHLVLLRSLPVFLYVVQGIFTIGEYVQCIVDGFIDMMDMVMILMIGYAMQEVMYRMGMESL